MDKVILEKKQLPSAVGSEMSILIKTFIFKYISWFICSDMYLLHANIQTPGLRKLEKGILMKDMNSKIKAEKCKEKKIHLVLQVFLSLHIRLFFMGRTVERRDALPWEQEGQRPQRWRLGSLIGSLSLCPCSINY